jgi:hypothetical protein
VDGVDDLGCIDSLEIGAGDAEVSVPELALNDWERESLARHLDRVSVPQLMRREPPPDACHNAEHS